MTTSKERFCWNCGDSMGFIPDKYHDRRDTCGKRECEREARDEERAERDIYIMERDHDFGW